MYGLIRFNGLWVLEINSQGTQQMSFYLVSGLESITKQCSLHICNKIIVNDAT